MKPYYQDQFIKIYCGDAIKTLSELPEKSISCCVTSPPYWGLRDYGHEGQLGAEPFPEDYIENMVKVFREVYRALKDDGTLWLNLGDSYWNNYGGGSSTMTTGNSKAVKQKGRHNKPKHPLFKIKDLVGIPWRVAFALQADGWYLRQDIIWHKPNPMPESVRDRCTKAHEYIFLFSKSKKYYFDAKSIEEDAISERRGKSLAELPIKNKKNKRSVWSVSTKPFKGAHFATFPPDLIEPCVLAGCPEGGIVLDPFSGAGTTTMLARTNGRKAIGIEINEEYCEISKKRLTQT